MGFTLQNRRKYQCFFAEAEKGILANYLYIKIIKYGWYINIYILYTSYHMFLFVHIISHVIDV